MKSSILPVFVVLVFVYCFTIVRRARAREAIGASEARSVYLLLLGFLVWTVIVVVMGMKGLHVELMSRVPLLWQALVLCTLWIVGFVCFGSLRRGLRGVAVSTPGHWFVFVHVLRIGALGGIVKGMRGEVTSDYVFWIGGPDFLFGLSAAVVGWLTLRKKVGSRFLIVWNLIGCGLIVLPTFLPTPYWMNEPGFVFIFEFPMILAPSFVVPTFISLNLLHAWGVYLRGREMG